MIQSPNLFPVYFFSLKLSALAEISLFAVPSNCVQTFQRFWWAATEISA